MLKDMSTEENKSLMYELSDEENVGILGDYTVKCESSEELHAEQQMVFNALARHSKMFIGWTWKKRQQEFLSWKQTM